MTSPQVTAAYCHLNHSALDIRGGCQQRDSTPVAAAWVSRADDYAAWVWANLVNRTDVWGLYRPWIDDKANQHGTMTAPKVKDRGKIALTQRDLLRHALGETGCTVGLHTTSAENTCRFLAFDIDNHGNDGAINDQNFQNALRLTEKLQKLGIAALIEDSNGNGGFHVWVLLTSPTPAASVHSFAHEVLGELGITAETFPKQADIGEGYGNYIRLQQAHTRI